MDFIKGERCSLRVISAGTASTLTRWINNDDVTHLMFTGNKPVTYETASEMLRSKDDEVLFSIWAADNFIGTVGLYSIHPIARSAEFRIFIGDKEYWGRGIGTECTQMVLDYGFSRLNLNMIWLGVNIENKAAIRVYEKSGFVYEGQLRQVQYRNGRYYDVLRFSVLREEWGNE